MFRAGYLETVMATATVHSRLFEIHMNTQSRNQDIWLPSKRFIVTPAGCPRLYEILTTLTFGALRK